MAKQGKRYQAAVQTFDRDQLYSAADSLRIVNEMPAAKYDETVLLSIRLGVDPTKSDQLVRGGVVLPKGLGRTRTVLVFAKGEKESEARDAGADHVGLDDLIEQISGGWMDFDVAIATPDVMGAVAKIAKVLGPRGLMPNPKTGTVTFDVGDAVREAKAGKVEFRVDKGGNVHVPIGRKSFSPEDLQANLDAVVDAVSRAKPSAAKGVYLRTLHVSSSSGPAVAVDAAAYRR